MGWGPCTRSFRCPHGETGMGRSAGSGGSGWDPLSDPRAWASPESGSTAFLGTIPFGNLLCHGQVLLTKHLQEGSCFSKCIRDAAYHQVLRVARYLTSLLSGWEELDAQTPARVFPGSASLFWGSPAAAPSLRGSSLPSSPFGMLFNSTSASCILASWHAACFYFSWICLDDEAC